MMSDRIPAASGFELSGDGPLVVLIHPGGVDSRFWERCVPYLSRRVTVATYDRPHHGRYVDGDGSLPSGITTGGDFLTWLDDRRQGDPDESDLLASRIAAADAGPVHLVGALDGGSIALRVAMPAAGPVVDGVVTIDSVVPGVGADPAGVIADVGLDGLRDLADLLPTILSDGDPTPYVDWFMRRHGFADRSPELVERVRTMVRHNAVAGMIPAPPTRVTEEDLRSAHLRLLALRSGNRPESLRRLDDALAATASTGRVETIGDGSGFQPVTDPADVSARIVEHVYDAGA